MNNKCFDGFIVATIVLGLAAIIITIAKQNMDETPLLTEPVQVLPAQHSTTTPSTTPQLPALQPVQKSLRAGQSFTHDGTKVTFVDVAGDSRCPADVDCVWSGEFSGRFTLEKNNDLELLVVKDTATSSSSSYNLRIVDVKPNKTTDLVIKDKDYLVTMLIEPRK